MMVFDISRASFPELLKNALAGLRNISPHSRREIAYAAGLRWWEAECFIETAPHLLNRLSGEALSTEEELVACTLASLQATTTPMERALIGGLVGMRFADFERALGSLQVALGEAVE